MNTHLGTVPQFQVLDSRFKIKISPGISITRAAIDEPDF
jgi:hypothetical protein